MLAVVAQVSWLPFVRPLGVVPAIVLVVIVLAALESMVSRALMLAVAAGLALDLLSGANFGLWTGILVLETLIAGLVRQAGIDGTQWYVPAVLVAGGTLVLTLAIWLNLVTVASTWPVGWMTATLGIQIVLNLMVMTLVRPLVHWLAADEAGGW